MAYALEAALDYAARGFSVIPITDSREEGREMKKPLIRWREWESRAAGPEQIKQWWKMWPNAGVAIVTGAVSGVLVMDIDPKNGGTAEGLPPTDMVVNTGGGGQHYYYKMVPGQRNRAGANGVDVRADGGYVVAPPSLHMSGEAYAWDPDEEPGEIDQVTIAKLSPTKSDLKAAQAPANGAAQPERETWIMDTQAAGVDAGQRNDSIARLAGYYAGKGVAHEMILQICRDANAKFQPPLGDDEVQRTVRSIWETERRKQAVDSKDAPALTPEQVTEEEELQCTNFDDYANKYGGQEVRWLIPGFLTDCTMGFIYGPPQSYKTWGEFDLAVSIAQGTPFLGVAKPARTGPVIVFQQEDSHITTSERIATIWAGRAGLKKPRVEDGKFYWEHHKEKSNIFMYEQRDFRFDDPSAMAKLEKLLIKHKPVAVFMDPFYSLVKTENNMEAAMEPLIDIKKLRDKYSCTFMFIHHTSKASRGTGQRDGLHGSQFLNASNESSLGFNVVEGQRRTIVMQPHSKDGGPKNPIRVDYDIFDGTSDDPGEWRFNTKVADITEEEMHKLIDRDRKPGDDDGPYGVVRPQVGEVPELSEEEAQKERSMLNVVSSGKLTRNAAKKMPSPLRAALDRMLADGRVRYNESMDNYFSTIKPLTPRVSGVK